MAVTPSTIPDSMTEVAFWKLYNIEQLLRLLLGILLALKLVKCGHWLVASICRSTLKTASCYLLCRCKLSGRVLQGFGLFCASKL